MRTIVDEIDFNLHMDYKLFDILYSVSKEFRETKIQTWVVVGFHLNSSSDKRCFEYLLNSYPISVAIQANVKCLLSDLRNHFISKDKNEIIEWKRELLKSQFNIQLQNLGE